jgi:hypothetical protein
MYTICCSSSYPLTNLEIDLDNIFKIQKMSNETRLDKTFQLEMGKGWEPI